MFSLPYIPLRTQMPAPSRNAAFISHSCPPRALGLPPRRVTFQFINSIKEKSFGGKAVLEVEGGDQWLMGQSGLSLFLVNREQIALQPPIFTSRQRRRKGQRKFWTVVSLLHLSLQVTKANQELLGKLEPLTHLRCWCGECLKKCSNSLWVRGNSGQVLP